VRPLAFCLTLLVLTSACETSTDNLIGIGGGGSSITQADVAGNWSFSVTKTTTLACTGGALADGQVVTTAVALATNGTVDASTSIWQNQSSGLLGPLAGAVRFSDGFADFTLSLSSGSTKAMELRGTMTTNGNFSGTITDPAPGFSPVFGTSGCEYVATGTKV
jgi:hypothetical protein